MANVMTGNVWLLDTAGSISTSPVKIRYIKFNYVNQADTFTLQDNTVGSTAKRTVFTNAKENATTYFYLGGYVFQGLYLSAITSGASLEICVD